MRYFRYILFTSFKEHIFYYLVYGIVSLKINTRGGKKINKLESGEKKKDFFLAITHH